MLEFKGELCHHREGLLRSDWGSNILLKLVGWNFRQREGISAGSRELRNLTGYPQILLHLQLFMDFELNFARNLL